MCLGQIVRNETVFARRSFWQKQSKYAKLWFIWRGAFIFLILRFLFSPWQEIKDH
jgi:hypothetical protein